MAETHKAKSVLGKGLSALIPRAPMREEPVAPAALSSDTGADNVIVAVDIARVKPNPYQPRLDFDMQALDELKRSIIEKGVIQPITVRRSSDGNYELISGERRVLYFWHAIANKISGDADLAFVRENLVGPPLAGGPSWGRRGPNPSGVARESRE